MRSVMNQECLGELLTLAFERDLTHTIDLDEIANPWSKQFRSPSMPVRRLRVGIALEKSN
jgi:hypothetical protein